MNGLYRDYSEADLPIVFVRDTYNERSLGRFAPFGAAAFLGENLQK